jgi:hypothetical protein
MLFSLLAAHLAAWGTAEAVAAARQFIDPSQRAAVTVKQPDDAERKATIGLTGQYRPEGTTQIALRLADLDAAVREMGSPPVRRIGGRSQHRTLRSVHAERVAGHFPQLSA